MQNGRHLRILIRMSSALVLVTILLAACAGPWVIGSVDTPAKNGADDTVIIEQLQTRRSPKIKTFRHYDLDIHKESAGSRYNDSYATNEVRTAPGRVQMGVVFPKGKRVYYPEVEFTAASGHRYQITWICIPFPYIALIDAGSGEIVAIDSYCPDCDALIGSPLLPASECLTHMQPPWLKPDNTSWLGSNWFLWTQENLYQNYRDICFAAEHGLAEAMMNLAFEFEYGFSVIQKDLVRAYVWYRLAANSGYDQAIANLERIEKTQLSSEQLGEAERLLNAQVPGQCVKDIKLLRSREPKFKVQTNNQTR